MTGYPWATGETLLAADLNAAIANAGATTDIVNVKNYGAKGDGVTDDTASIQNAANAIPTAGGKLLFPQGVYLITAPIKVKSRTTVEGAGATLQAGVPMSMLTNQNNTVTTLTDHDIIVHDLTLDYGVYGDGPGWHAIDMAFVSHAEVRNCTIQCRGAGDAVSFMGCYNTLMDGCTAYGFTNCAYDHWWGPQKARVVNCYAETTSSVQMVCFNPEDSTLALTGLTASEFVLANCQFRGTGATAIPTQIETLRDTTSLRNIIIQGNSFNNCMLAIRGAITGVVVANNTFDGCLGGDSVIESYGIYGGTPSDILVTGNVIINPSTVAGAIAVVRVGANNAVITNNMVIGGAGGLGIDTSGFASIVLGNYVSTGLLNTPNAIGQAGPIAFPGGLSAGPTSVTSLAASGYTQLGWSNADTVVGAQAASSLSATSGHLLIPFVSGTPTGVPANANKGTALRYDILTHKLWAYDVNGNAWRGVAFT